MVAHDHCKPDLLDWARFNRDLLARHRLVATGTTGRLLERELALDVELLRSGPLGGDLQIGARIAEGGIDLLVFFWDPLEAQPHDPDVRALLRIAVVWNVPAASNRATADYLVSSSLLGSGYEASTARRIASAVRDDTGADRLRRLRSSAGSGSAKLRGRALLTTQGSADRTRVATPATDGAGGAGGLFGESRHVCPARHAIRAVFGRARVIHFITGHPFHVVAASFRRLFNVFAPSARLARTGSHQEAGRAGTTATG